jgi:hypothetical protein
MQKAKADADLRVKSATERLNLADKLRRSEAEVRALKDENKQLNTKCSKLEATALDNEKVLESLRKTVERDANEKAAFKGRITELERVHAKVGELEQVFAEVASRAEVVYREYKKGLAALGAEPLPLPEPAEGSQVILQLLDWLLSEFEGLGEVMSVANDNAASVSFEGLVGNLLRAGAVDLSKLEGAFQYVPYEGLSEEVSQIQDVKMAYFERFWEPSGKVVVRTLAAAATGVIFSFGLPFVFVFLLSHGKNLLFAQELNVDHPSEVGSMPEAGRSPSGREADGSPRAQV